MSIVVLWYSYVTLTSSSAKVHVFCPAWCAGLDFFFVKCSTKYVELLLLQMSWIRVLPSHSCGGTLQKARFKLLHSSIFLYGSDCWAISKTDARKMDALDQLCLHILLGIKWYQFIPNDDVLRLTKQPKLTAIIQSLWLTLFGHIMRMDNNADAKRILLASPPADWRRQHHVAQHRPTGSETTPPYVTKMHPYP